MKEEIRKTVIGIMATKDLKNEPVDFWCLRIEQLIDQAIQSERSKMLDDLKYLRTDIHSYLIFEVVEDIAYKVGDMLGDFILSHDKTDISNEIKEESNEDSKK